MNHLRRTLRLLVVLAGIGALTLVVATPPALGCSCALTTLEQRVEEASAVAVVETVEQVPSDDGEEVWAATPVDVFKGSPPATVHVFAGSPTSSCGHRPLRAGELLGVTVSAEGRSWVTGCSAPIPLDTLAELYAPIEQPDASGRPAFAAGLSRPGARIGLVDENGGLLASGDERGDVQLIAACPGGETIATLVTGPYPSDDVAVVTRHVATLEVITTRVLDLTANNPYDPPPLRDFTCHSADGESISYLVPRLEKEKQRERHPDQAESQVIVLDGERIMQVPATTASDIAADLENNVLYALDGDTGAVQRWVISTATLAETIPIEDLVVRDLIVHPGGGAVAFAGPAKGWGSWLVHIADGEAKATNLAENRRPIEIHAVAGGFVSLARARGGRVMIQSRADDGTLLDEFNTGSGWPLEVAAGDPTAYEFRGEVRVIDAEPPSSDRPAGITALAALPVESREIVVTVESLPPRFERHGQLPAPPTQQESPTPVVETATPRRNPLPLVAIGVLLVGLVAFAAVTTRTRRR